ncbi:protein translocase subunit SecD [Bartonella tamiae]|uniref:Multifunctional fusion protein n=1 Tax=Bartonella tamiae Th239 TaxID=1094558 RepID=J1K0X8_9HYPH|nr:protein translocase subunit SecD [Bartonella tamiae]EJF90705.1 protein-export membrane protein SecD [Bartonella tamiae Th239]EJF93918.1 protein-export membrane protein SecD [Bartonella tamiae Th307]
MLYFPLWKRLLIWLVVFLGFLIALPNILPQSLLSKLPNWYSTLHLSMGVDLQGGSRLVVQLPEYAIDKRDETMDVMRRRLDMVAIDFNDYTIHPQGHDKIRVEVPGLFDVQYLKDIVSVTAKLSLYPEDNSVPVNDVVTGKMGKLSDSIIGYSFDDPPAAYLMKKIPLLTNKNIVGAATDSAENGQAFLTITLDTEGQKKLADFTQNGENHRLISVFDNEVLMALSFPEQISEGYIRIGPFADDVARNLQTVLSTGPLPADLTFIEERTIGGELGADYAKSGLYAALGALIVVALFMILSYGLLGLAADIALASNLFILLAILSIIGTPLTLAGFAGLVLIIGVSVDANILIYERIREARRQNYSVAQAIEAGFYGALNTILDANITTLIAAVVLFFLGVGPIHGFALTVTIGILTSLFTTIVFTRMMISWWVKTFRPTEIPQRIIRLIPQNTAIPFMSFGKVTLGLAVILILATIGLFSTVGINYGIDFRGGSLAVLEAKNGEADLYDVAHRVMNLNIGGVTIEPSKSASIALLSISSQGNGEDAEQTVAVKLRTEFDDYNLQRMDVVGPTVSEELSQASLLAIFVSLLAIFGYVWLRFRWQFALGAVLTTIHDIFILIGVFLLFQWQFNLWSIAALLAIIGYSLNDTIVVYDRVRFLLTKQGTITMSSLVDLAINRTLSRTILTSLATLVAHIPLYYFGGTDMKDFASVLLLGIVIGTYSSIFIAGPLLVLLRVKPASSALTQ